MSMQPPVGDPSVACGFIENESTNASATAHISFLVSLAADKYSMLLCTILDLALFILDFIRRICSNK